MEMGISGKEIGRVLGEFLDEVMKAPERNSEEELKSMAENKK